MQHIKLKFKKEIQINIFNIAARPYVDNIQNGFLYIICNVSCYSARVKYL